MSAAKLVTKRGPASQPEFELPEQTMVMGRDNINDIVLNDLEVSRRHAAITFRSGRYFIEDLGSTNGTFVNGRRVTVATPLKDGDVVDLAQSISLAFHWPDDPAAALVKPPPAFDEMEDTAADFGDLAAHFEPEVDNQAIAPPPVVAKVPGLSWRERLTERRFLIGCSFVLLAAIAGCVASALLLDALAPETLYCGPLQSLFELLGTNLVCP